MSSNEPSDNITFAAGVGATIALALAGCFGGSPASGVAGPEVGAANVIPSPIGADSSAHPMLGVNADLASMAPAARDRALALLASAGVEALRVPVDWSRLEPSPGDRRWSKIDEMLDAALRVDLRVLVTLERAPAWSRRDPAPPVHILRCLLDPESLGAVSAPPTDAADAASIAADIVRRRPELWAIEVWSEPNLHPKWRELGPDPEDYAEFLGVVADAVHAVRDDVLVISAGLAPTTDLSECAMSDVVFLDRVARTGVLDRVDAIGIEPFGLREGADDRRADREILNFARARVLIDVLDRNDISAPLWAVAWGWRADTGGPADAVSPWGGFPAHEAATHLRRGWKIARRELPEVGPMFVWHLHPTSVPTDPQAGFALLDAFGEPTRLYEAVAAIGSEAPAPAAAAGSADRAEESRPPIRALVESLFVSLVAIGVVVIAFLVWCRGFRSGAVAFGRSGLIRTGAARFEAAAGHPGLPWAWAIIIGLNALATRSIGLADAGGADAPVPAVVAVSALTGGLVVALGLVLATFRPPIVLAAIFAMAPFFYSLRLSFAARAVGPVELLIAIAMVGALVRVLIGRLDAPSSPTGAERRDLAAGDRAAPGTVELALLGGLILWSGASIGWSDFQAPALRELRTVIVEPILVYCLLRLQGPLGRRAALDGFVFGAVLASIAGLAELVLASTIGDGGVLAEGVLRANGPYASPNNLALWLGRALAAAAAFVVAAGPRSTGTDRRRRRYALALVPLSIGLFATFSRGALLFGASATVGYLVLLAGGGRIRRRPILLVLPAVLALGIALLPFVGSERIRGAVSIAPGSTGYIRLHLWSSAVEMGKDHPVLGVGLDNFLPLYRDRYVHREVIQERFLSHPHNALLDWWTRLGVPGVILFGSLLWLGLRRWPAIVHRRERRGNPEAAAGLGLIVYSLAHGMVDNHFFLVDLALAWWLGLSLVLDSGTLNGLRPPTDDSDQRLGG